MRSPHFEFQLERANAKPESKEAKELPKYISQHMKPVAVPWSEYERKGRRLEQDIGDDPTICHPSFFCTINPSDMDSSLMLRMVKCGGQSAQRNFELPSNRINDIFKHGNSIQRSPKTSQSYLKSESRTTEALEKNLAQERPTILRSL